MPCEVSPHVEERAEPARHVLLDLHDGRARLPQADVAVHALREELAERRGEQPSARMYAR